MAVVMEKDVSFTSRRSFVKLMAASPLLATIGARNLAAAVTNAVKPTGARSYTDNVYTRLGVRPLINARGTWTYVSGSLELPGVRDAAIEGSHFFVDMFELQDGVGRYLAKLSGAESGIVTSGAAGAMACATAGCIAGTDPNRVWQLPDTTGLKGEVVIMGGRSAFDSAIRLTGAKLVIAHTVDDLPTALSSQTAMVYTTWKDDRLQQILKITKPAGVPVLLDDAAGIPPYENFTNHVKTGVDLFCFSGGKGLCGPQSAGLLLGRKDLIDAAMANNNPWEGAVCRPMKAGKEEIVAMLAALDYWSKADLGALNKEWQSRVERIQKLVDTVPGVTSDIAIPKGGNSYPTLTVNWDEAKFGLTVAQCAQQLRDGEPRIEVLTDSNPSGVLARLRKGDEGCPGHPNRLQIISMTLQPGEDLIVGNRLRKILNQARKQSA
jgi:seryl-tRNA(Sec) selenium transferase